MNESELTSANIAEYKAPADRNVEVIADQILSDLNSAVALSTIQEVINEVIPKYRNARIQMFVPIFIRRDAVDQLKAMQAFFSTPVKALVGLFNALYNSGHTVVSVERLLPDADPTWTTRRRKLKEMTL